MNKNMAADYPRELEQSMAFTYNDFPETVSNAGALGFGVGTRCCNAGVRACAAGVRVCGAGAPGFGDESPLVMLGVHISSIRVADLDLALE